MDGQTPISLEQVLYTLLTVAGVTLVLAVLVLGWVLWRVKQIHLPEDADALTALRLTPLSVVIFLDLLDMSLDFLSAPFAWVLLSYLGLKPLRKVTVMESLIPATQFIPTMTAAWIVARLTDPARRR